MTAWFRVEAVVDRRMCVYVIAQLVQGKSFTVIGTSTLSGVPIEPWLEQPRRLREDGTPDGDVFAFTLKDARDRELFHQGQVVELVP